MTDNKTVWTANTSKGEGYEGDTLEKLIEGIAAHFADGYMGPDESDHPPYFSEVYSFDGDTEYFLTAAELVKFNTDLDDAFEDAIEGWGDISYADEHSTHWGL